MKHFASVVLLGLFAVVCAAEPVDDPCAQPSSDEMAGAMHRRSQARFLCVKKRSIGTP
jgi:hypothetical protein